MTTAAPAQINVSDFISFVKSKQGQVFETLTRKRKFTVAVTEKGMEFTPTATMKRRSHELQAINRVVERFCRTRSYTTTNYTDITYNSSYTLALIGLYLSQNEDTQSGDAISRVISNSDTWTDIEYEECVKAYLGMLEEEQKGKPYKKSDVNNKLRLGALKVRSKASIEYRMQNISAVLQELCLPWINGYKPAINVGIEGRKVVKRFLAMHGAYNPMNYTPTADANELDQKVQKIRKTISTSCIPEGQIQPQRHIGTTLSYARDPLVKAWILENANGICESCGSPAPFFNSYNEPFLEVHHVKILADGGKDTICNAIAVCPNCHRRYHHSKDKNIETDNLYKSVPRLNK
jgi:5-methylcytosine-specific restriction enzyme A